MTRDTETGRETVNTGGRGGSETVDGGHGVHTAQEQRQPLPGHGIGLHEVRGRVEVQEVGSLPNAPCRQAESRARRQVHRAVRDIPGDAVGQQLGQSAVDRGVRLAQDERQLRRFDERHPGQGVEQLSVGESHGTSVAKKRPGGQSPSDSGSMLQPQKTMVDLTERHC